MAFENFGWIYSESSCAYLYFEIEYFGNCREEIAISIPTQKLQG